MAWPAMAEDEGNSVRASRAVVKEVDCEVLDLDSVVLKAVKCTPRQRRRQGRVRETVFTC